MLSEYQRKLENRIIRRQGLFLRLSVISVVVALGLAVYYAYQALTQPGFDTGVHFVVVLLILLNARQNLRQYHLAQILAETRTGKRLEY